MPSPGSSSRDHTAGPSNVSPTADVPSPRDSRSRSVGGQGVAPCGRSRPAHGPTAGHHRARSATPEPSLPHRSAQRTSRGTRGRTSAVRGRSPPCSRRRYATTGAVVGTATATSGARPGAWHSTAACKNRLASARAADHRRARAPSAATSPGNSSPAASTPPPTTARWAAAHAGRRATSTTGPARNGDQAHQRTPRPQPEHGPRVTPNLAGLSGLMAAEQSEPGDTSSTTAITTMRSMQ